MKTRSLWLFFLLTFTLPFTAFAGPDPYYPKLVPKNKVQVECDSGKTSIVVNYFEGKQTFEMTVPSGVKFRRRSEEHLDLLAYVPKGKTKETTIRDRDEWFKKISAESDNYAKRILNIPNDCMVVSSPAPAK